MRKALVWIFLAKILIIGFWATIFMVGIYVPSKISLFKENTINVATWTDLIDPRLMEEFYNQTGIHVNLSYFEDNYELVQKLKVNDGQGYDLIIPSDFAIQKLIQYNLLKPLNKEKFLHWDRLNSRLLDTYNDPSNIYSIPYHWALYGLGIDGKFFGELPQASWSIIFQKPHPSYTVGVIGAPRETILMVAQYLFKTIDNLSVGQLQQIEKLLINQKEWVEAYTEFRADYLLLSQASPVVVITTPHILRLLKIRSNIQFLLPQEGGFQVVDSWVIPKGCVHEDMVYQFLNFMYQKKVLQHHFNKYTFFPATLELYDLLSSTTAGKALAAIHHTSSKSVDFFRNVVDEDVLNSIWISVKSS